jgi:putative membrane protein
MLRKDVVASRREIARSPTHHIVITSTYGGSIMSERNSYKTLAIATFLATNVCAWVYADTPPENGSKLNDKDGTFLQQAAENGGATTQLAKMALDKSSDAKVKQLAQQIVDDQNKANDQVKTLAQTKQLTLPTDANADSQKQAKQLQEKSGQAFDEAWIKAVVSDQQKTAKAFTQEGKDAKDNDVKQLAQGALPTLNSHVKAAQALAAIPAARDDAMKDAMKASATSPMSAMPATTTNATTISDTPAASAAAAAVKH